MDDLTPNEKAMLLSYTEDCYTDGDPTQETWAWSLCGTKTRRAVWGSLVKKGYGWSNHTGEREGGYSTDTAGLTDKGVAAYRQLAGDGK